MACPDLLVVGNLIVDDLVFDDGRTRMGLAGGAVLYGALGAALWGIDVGIVSVAGTDYPEDVFDELTRKGVRLEGVRRLSGPGLRVWLLYEPVGRRLVQRPNRPSHAEASPLAADVPVEWLDARAIHLSPAPIERQSPLVHTLSATTRARLSLDPHTPIADETLVSWLPVLERLDLLFINREELSLGVHRGVGDGTGDWCDRLMGTIARGRLRTVAVKRGAEGGVLLQRDRPAAPWHPRVSTLVDPTGAGDAFAGGVLAGLISGAETDRALSQGVVSASFAMEAWGAAALLAATPDTARDRLGQWYGGADVSRIPSASR